MPRESRIERALALARADADAPYLGGARAEARAPRRLAIGDPQAPLARFLAILDAHAALGNAGRLREDVQLVALGDYFDWGGRAERESVARSGLELLAWLAAHPAEQVTLILGNHDLGRVGELAGFDDAAFRSARAEADAIAAGGDPQGFRERYPQLPSAQVASRDLATFHTSQGRLVRELLRARRFCAAAAAGPRLLLSHAGLTCDDLDVAGLRDAQQCDARATAAALDASLDRAVAGWRDGAPLEIQGLHQPGSAERGEGRGVFCHRPGHPEGRRHDELGFDLFAGPPRRRFDPRRLPMGLVQAIGHIGDAKCRELLGPWAAAPPARTGSLRHLRTDGHGVAYEPGLPASLAEDEAVLLFLDGSMARADADRYELLDLATQRPAARPPG